MILYSCLPGQSSASDNINSASNDPTLCHSTKIIKQDFQGVTRTTENSFVDAACDIVKILLLSIFYKADPRCHNTM